MGNSGLCSACLNDLGATTLEKKAPKNKLRPLLSDLEADFKEFSGEDGMLDRDELYAIWRKAAEKKLGKLSEEDDQLLQKSTRDFFRQMDIEKDGKVSYQEFIATMLGGTEERGPMKDMRSKLNEQFAQDPSKISELIEQFKRWDKNGDGYVTPDELEDHLKDLESMSGQGNNDAAKLRKMREEIFKEADVDADGRVDLWEVMAHTLGRRKQSVEVLLYDISKGAATKFGEFLIGKKVQAVHSGVLVYGSEYWYGGKVFKTKAPCSKCFGEPLRSPWNLDLPPSEFDPGLPVVQVGYTFVTQQEFTHWLSQNIVPRYTGIEKYDLLTHSCNHFSNELVTFLTGEQLPSKILELQKMALTPTVQALRPYLNKYLGGFGEAGMELTDDLFTKESAPPHLNASQSGLMDSTFTGESVVVTGIRDVPVIGTIIRTEADGTFEVKYFDPETSEITVKSGVKESQMQRMADDDDD